MGDGYEDAWVFGYRPPVYRVPFDDAVSIIRRRWPYAAVATAPGDVQAR